MAVMWTYAPLLLTALLPLAANPVVTTENSLLYLSEQVQSLKYSPQGTYLAVLTTGGMQVFQTASKQCVLEVRFPVSPMGRNPTAFLMKDAKPCSHRQELVSPTQEDVLQPERITFSQDERFLLAGGHGLVLVSLPLGKPPESKALAWSREIREGAISDLRPVIFAETLSPLGKWATWVTSGQGLSLYGIDTQKIQTFDLQGAVTQGIQFDGAENRMVLWDALGWKQYAVPSGKVLSSKEYSRNENVRIMQAAISEDASHLLLWLQRSSYNNTTTSSCSWIERHHIKDATTVFLGEVPHSLDWFFRKSADVTWFVLRNGLHYVVRQASAQNLVEKRIIVQEDLADAPSFVQFSTDNTFLWFTQLGRSARNKITLAKHSLTDPSVSLVEIPLPDALHASTQKLVLSPNNHQAAILGQNAVLYMADF